MLIKAIIIGFLGYLTNIDERIFGASMMTRPIIMGPLVGLVLGDLQQGIIIGATLEALFIGVVMVGAAIPPDVGIAGVLSTALAIMTNSGAEVAVAMAMPFAVLAQANNMLVFTVDSWVVERGIKRAKVGDTKGLTFWHYFPLLIRLPIGILTFLIIYLGTKQAQGIVDLMPQKLMDGFSVAAGLLPAVGFAMLVQIMISKKLAPYFFVGFMFATYLGMPVIGVSILGLLIAMLIVSNGKSTNSGELSGEEEF
jgi:mannose/fructose/N-acetylgalactosamine-specific phosphotransferase system component IIC